jgi:hypothetical protein
LEIRQTRIEFYAGRRTDKPKLIVVFRDFANALKASKRFSSATHPLNIVKFSKSLILYDTFLGPFVKLQQATGSFIMSVRLSAWNNSAPTGRIFMKFHI